MPSADLSRVGAPVSGSGSLPFDGDGGGDVDADAEGAGEDCGGQRGGKLEQRGRSGLRKPDAGLAEPFAHLPSRNVACPW